MATPVLDTAVAWWRAADYTSGDYITDGSGNAHNALIGSAEGADTNDPLFLSPDGYTDYDNPGTQYLYLPGTTGDNAQVVDAAYLDITQDIDVQVKVALNDWTPSTETNLIAKWSGGGQSSWIFCVDTSANLKVYISTDGTNFFTKSSDPGPTVSDGAALWVRFTSDRSEGNIKFYTGGSGDTPSWSQLGDTITGFQVGSAIFSGSSDLFMGKRGDNGQAEMTGKFYRAIIYADLTQTDKRLDVDFTDRTNVVEPFATFTESSSNAATVTINRSATGAKSTVVDYPLFLLHTDDYLQVADHADLNFGASDSFTVLFVGTFFSDDSGALVVKRNDRDPVDAGYSMHTEANQRMYSGIADGTVETNAGTTFGEFPDAVGTKEEWALVRNVATDKVETYLNAVGIHSATDGTSDSLTNALNLTIGAWLYDYNQFLDCQFYGAAIFRSALSTADLATAADELMGNESADATRDKLINLIETLLLSNEQLVTLLALLSNEDLVRLYE